MATKTGTLRVIEPATEQVLAELQEATVEDADQAVARAKAAYPAWKALNPKDRGNLLRAVGPARARHRHVRDDAGRASGQHQQPIRETDRFLDVMGHQQGGDRAAPHQLHQLGPQAFRQSGVERHEGLVEDQEIGRDRKGATGGLSCHVRHVID